METNALGRDQAAYGLWTIMGYPDSPYISRVGINEKSLVRVACV